LDLQIEASGSAVTFDTVSGDPAIGRVFSFGSSTATTGDIRSSHVTDAAAALEKLCRTYWYPLYAFLRRKGRGPHDAQDLTQAFFAHLLARSFLENVGPQKGKFRSFLLAALQHFLSDEWDRARAAKRGGGQTFISIDDQVRGCPEQRSLRRIVPHVHGPGDA
jgi:DNA-directed RNA polymerase specialized sigma24 family protein